MFTHTTKVLEKDRVIHYTIKLNDKQLLYSEVIEKWRNDEDFRIYFAAILRDAPFPAYFWETPSLTSATINRPFVFVLVKSTYLAKVKPEPKIFSQYFRSSQAKNDVVAFPNLGKNAILVAPCPVVAPKTYSHLAAFIRGAESKQIHAFWQLVGEAMQQRINKQPVWLSTAGTGVYWLHVRLDNRPKYYRFSPFKRP